MSKPIRYTLYVFFIAFGWLSQLLFPDFSVLEPLAWTGFVILIAIIIEVFAKP